MNEQLLGNLDFPYDGSELSGYAIMVQGWAFSTDGKEPLIEVYVDEIKISTTKTGIARPDVSAAYPSATGILNSGFLHKVNLLHIEDGNHTVKVIARCGDQEKFLGKTNFVLHKKMFTRKQEKILDMLVCPKDKNTLRHENDFLQCTRCLKKYHIKNGIPIMMSDIEFQYVSSNSYSSKAIELIKRHADGLVLNDGAGYPHQQFENVIHLEVTDLPSTNVVASGDELPFSDESIDAIISLAVIEHLEDPFAYAKEIHRVCKKGAEILIDSAFMQPIHNYPQHYFNTTLEGLKLLFKDFKLIHATVDEYQKPWITLQWILNSYLGGLEPGIRDKFLNLKISELLEIYKKEGAGSEISKLSEYTTEELAAGVQFYGIKE